MEQRSPGAGDARDPEHDPDHQEAGGHRVVAEVEDVEVCVDDAHQGGEARRDPRHLLAENVEHDAGNAEAVEKIKPAREEHDPVAAAGDGDVEPHEGDEEEGRELPYVEVIDEDTVAEDEAQRLGDVEALVRETDAEVQAIRRGADCGRGRENREQQREGAADARAEFRSRGGHGRLSSAGRAPPHEPAQRAA